MFPLSPTHRPTASPLHLTSNVVKTPRRHPEPRAEDTTMHLHRREAANDAFCPPSVVFCNPSIGPGPAMVSADQNANTLIRQPSDPNVNTLDQHDVKSEAEINAVGIIVIVIIVVVLFGLWAGFAQWPRGKIKGWWKLWKANKMQKTRLRAEKADGKAVDALAEGTLGATASAVDLTEADIEAAVSQINAKRDDDTSSLKGARTIRPPLEKQVSSTSTVVVEEPDGRTKDELSVRWENVQVPGPEESLPALPTVTEPRRAVTRGSSFPRLPSIPLGLGSPLMQMSMRFKK
ncbi:hypothetical protein EIP91_008858 [Steccherinum ochraceum]|uniref:Uncharacterized protein n=1 Tax=Steccherinum ochraceum TaxID=92696 RepID=A0A4R0S234_9APHY|nr:hypothetical protein EIP91_008858 [Steccherinum ochraceum]